jgi:hypothetical protein
MTAATPAMMGDADAPPVVEDPAAPSMQAVTLAGPPVGAGAGLPVRPQAGGPPTRTGAGTGRAEMPPAPRVDAWDLGPRPPARLGEQRGAARGPASTGTASGTDSGTASGTDSGTARGPGSGTGSGTASGTASGTGTGSGTRTANRAGTEGGGGTGSEGYVRLRLRLDRGRLSVAGARAVAGPLLQPVRLHTGLACEVMVAGRRVAVESIPDLGVWRALPEPGQGGGGPAPGHHVTELDAFEFQMRVPRDDLPLAVLADARVTVYRCKSDAPTDPIGPGPIAEQFRRELREVARVDGVRLWELAPEVQEELRAQLG